MTVPDGRIMVASLENAKAAVQNALNNCPQSRDWDEAWEDTFTDAAYDLVEQIRELLGAMEQRLL